jgi:hypothetical protein
VDVMASHLTLVVPMVRYSQPNADNSRALARVGEIEEA